MNRIQSGKCRPFHIERREIVGNVMVLHRAVEAGEVVLEEAAAVHGPSSKSGKKAVCMECQGGIQSGRHC